jgi:hypothetical protein
MDLCECVSEEHRNGESAGLQELSRLSDTRKAGRSSSFFFRTRQALPASRVYGEEEE